MRLSKKELLERLNYRCLSRYGSGLDAAWLNDLIKDGLIDRLDRGANIGLKPQYYATGRHYRRALQIKRLQAIGICSRDALLLQLFIRGYGAPAALVGSALKHELRRALTIADVQLQSAYFDNTKTPGPKHRGVVSRQMGEIDKRFAEANLELPQEVYLAAVRQFRAAPKTDRPDFFTGLLAAGSPVKQRVTNASPNQLGIARDALSGVNRILLRPKFGNAILNTPEYVALLLAQFLLMAGEGFSFGKMADMMNDSSGFLDLVDEFLASFPEHQ